MDEPSGFAEFVAGRSAALLRSAWLLTGDVGLAEDLVQTALTKTWVRWHRVERTDAPEAYVRRVMLSVFLTWTRRRAWGGEVAVTAVPDGAAPGDAFAVADVRHAVQAALADLPARQRAVVVLRYFDDLTEAQAAAVLGCSLGTVKSQNAKAMAKLRSNPCLAPVWKEERAHGRD
jgi:RNA polymerase sigma-70 factor (sigma-E family)